MELWINFLSVMSETTGICLSRIRLLRSYHTMVSKNPTF